MISSFFTWLFGFSSLMNISWTKSHVDVPTLLYHCAENKLIGQKDKTHSASFQHNGWAFNQTDANLLIWGNAQKKGFKSQPIAINRESEDRQAIGHRSQMAGNPSLLPHFFFFISPCSLSRFPAPGGLTSPSLKLKFISLIVLFLFLNYIKIINPACSLPVTQHRDCH